MRQITFTDEELKIAAGQVIKTLADSLPDPSEYEQPFEYSPEFLAKMDKLIKQEQRREVRARISRRVASFVLALLVCASAWLAVDVEARAAFFTWVREVYEDSFIYRYFGEKPEEGLQDYEISELPEGFDRTVYDNNGTRCIQLYQRANDTIFFMYYQMQDGWEHIVTAKEPDLDCTWKEVFINGAVADLYLYGSDTSANELVWIDEEVKIVFHLTGFLEEDLLIKVAESICLKKE